MFAAKAAIMIPGGIGISGGTEAGNRRCTNRSARGQLRIRAANKPRPPTAIEAIASAGVVLLRLRGAVKLRTAIALANDSAGRTIAETIAADRSTPARFASAATPANDHTFPGMYLARFDSMQMRAASTKRKDCRRLSTTHRHPSTRTAYVSQTSARLATSHSGDGVQ